MPPKLRLRVAEDPNNTWNHQLMQACLQNNLTEAETLLGNGADPVATREAVPFYSEPLPPLIAMILSGHYTPESVPMMDWLIDHGASVSAVIPLHGRQFVTEPGEEGTLLHLLVQMGQLVTLLEALSLIAEPRPPPISFIRRLLREYASDNPSTPRGVSPSHAGSEGGSSRRGGKSPRTGGDSVTTRSALGVKGGFGVTFGTQNTIGNIIFTLHVKGPCVDFGTRTSQSRLTVMDIALRRGDAQVVQLLHYYGCPMHFHRIVEGCLTPLARACAAGEREEVEALLDAGDVVGQISLDGRYTLIHYAAGHPAILDVLIARGLGIDAENAFGDSALISLICYGQGMNPEYAIRETPRSADAPRLAALPTAALRNYILTAAPPLVQNYGNRMGKTSLPGGSSSAGTEIDFPVMEPTADAWWYFATTSTWVMIQNLVEHGANVHGDLSPLERGKTTQRTQDNKNGIAYMTALAAVSAIECAAKITQEKTDTIPGSEGTAAVSDRTDTKRTGASPDPISEMYLWSVASTSHCDADQNDSKSFSGKDATIAGGEEDSIDLRPGLRSLLRLTPLMHAIVAYHPELIRRLAVDYRVDPMVCDAQGACALHYAALARSSSVMELLISPLVMPLHEHFDINVQDCRGRTPLHYAASQGNIDIVRALLTLGSTIHLGKVDFTGLTPLHLAVLSNKPTVVESLLHQSECLATVTSDVYSSTGLSGNTGSSRRKGAGASRRKGARQAIAPGRDIQALEAMTLVDVEAEDTAEFLTALELAVRKTRHVGVARVLLSVGCASVRHSSGLPRGGNLLHRVVHDGSIELLSLLLEHYADANDVDDDDHTPLHICAMLDLPQAPAMARELIRYGALPEAQSSITLETPILIAARLGRDEMLGVLLYRQNDMPSDCMFSLSFRTSGRERDRGFVNSSSNNNNAAGTPSSPTAQSHRGRRRCPSVSDTSAVPLPDGFIPSTRLRRGQRTQSRPSTSSLGSAFGDTGDDANTDSASMHPSKVIVPSEPVLANPHHLLLTDGRVRTPLHYLCAHSDPSRQSTLLPLVVQAIKCVLGPTLGLQLDAEGRTPLHEACAAGFAAATEELLRRDDGGVVFILDSHGNLPLHDAVVADDVESIRAIAKNASLWVPCQLRGLSAIVDEADVARSLPLTARLLQQQRQQQKQKESSALRGTARREMMVRTVGELLNVPDGMGRTPFMLAAELGKRKAAAALVSLIRQNPRFTRPSTAIFTDAPTVTKQVI